MTEDQKLDALFKGAYITTKPVEFDLQKWLGEQK